MIWTSTLFNLKSSENFTKEISDCHIVTYRFAIFRNMRLIEFFSFFNSSALNDAATLLRPIGPANGLTK